jgi:hypothetical protein
MMLLLERSPRGDVHLASFDDDKIPSYAILLHTWIEGQEVTCNEMETGVGTVTCMKVSQEWLSLSAYLPEARTVWLCPPGCSSPKKQSEIGTCTTNATYTYSTR